MLQKGSPEPFENLTSEQLGSFQTIAKELTSAPILHLSQPNLPYSLNTDASTYQIDRVLSQIDSDTIRCPIEYFSQTLHAVDRNCSTIEKECLSVV